MRSRFRIAAVVVLATICVPVTMKGQTVPVPAPVIESVTPNVVPTSGGTRIEIRGHNFLGPFCFPVCPWYGLTIGNVEISSQDFTVSDALIVATTPPHAAGTVSITFRPRLPDFGAPVVLQDALTYLEVVPALNPVLLALLAISLMTVGILLSRR